MKLVRQSVGIVKMSACTSQLLCLEIHQFHEFFTEPEVSSARARVISLADWSITAIMACSVVNSSPVSA